MTSPGPSEAERNTGGRKRRTRSQVSSPISNYFGGRKLSELRSSRSLLVEESLQPPPVSEYVETDF